MTYEETYARSLDSVPFVYIMQISSNISKKEDHISDIYYFSKAVLDTYCSLDQGGKDALFPLVSDICITYNWGNEIQDHIDVNKIKDEYLPYLAAIFFSTRKKEELEKLKEKLSEIEDVNLKERLQLSIDLYILHLNREFKEEYEEFASRYFGLIEDVELENYTRDMIVTLQNYLYYLSYIGNHDKFYHYLEFMKKLSNIINDPFRTISYHYSLGVDEFRTGKYKNARDNFIKALEIAQEINFKSGSYSMLSNKAITEYIMGYIQDAINTFEILLERAETKFQKFRSLANLGEAYLFAGNLKKAKESLKNALKLEKELGLHFPDLYSFMSLVHIYQEDKKSAREYLEKCKSVLEKSQVQQSIAIYHYIKGLYWLISENENLKAKKEFEYSLDIAVRNNIFEYILKNEIHLAVLALEEFSETSNFSVYANILYRLDNVLLLATEQTLPNVEIEAQLLRYATFRLSNKENHAEQALHEAKEIAQQQNFEFYMDMLNTISSDEEEIITSSLSRIRKMKIMQTSVKAESTIQGIVIADSNSGIILFEVVSDEDINFAVLITGLISAVRIREESILGTGSGFSSIKMEDKILILERLENTMLILITDHDSYKARTRLHTLAMDIQDRLDLSEMEDLSYEFEFNLNPFIEQSTREIFPELYSDKPNR